MSDAVRAVRARVLGRVQGVGFRWFAARAARELGLAGWVRNARDGSVEVAASGAAGDVERLLAVLRRGPSRADVQSVEVEECLPPAAGVNAQFEIIP